MTHKSDDKIVVAEVVAMRRGIKELRAALLDVIYTNLPPRAGGYGPEEVAQSIAQITQQDAKRWRMLMKMCEEDNKQGLIIGWWDVNADQRIDGLGGRDAVTIIDDAIEREETARIHKKEMLNVSYGPLRHAAAVGWNPDAADMRVYLNKE